MGEENLVPVYNDAGVFVGYVRRVYGAGGRRKWQRADGGPLYDTLDDAKDAVRQRAEETGRAHEVRRWW